MTRRAFTHAEEVAGTAQFLTADHLGSVTVVTDTTNVAVAQYAFDAWGRRSLVTGVDATKIGYTGHWNDAAGNLSLTLYRAYDPDLGRWLSEDPIGMPDGPNMYAYVANRVAIWNDPLGLQSCCDQLKRRRQRVNEILDQIESGREPSGSGVGGATVCVGNTPDPIDTGYIQRTMGPCLADCAVAHENRHARQCRRFGAEYMGNNANAMERSAYLVELGCIIRKMQTLSCCQQ